MAKIYRSTRLGAVALVLNLIMGCTNLDAVRDFGKTAAAVSAYPDATLAYQESVLAMAPYIPEPDYAQRAVEQRKSQVTTAEPLRKLITEYFAVMAKLAGEDAFSLDAQIEATVKSLDALPAGALDPAIQKSATSLAKILGKYVAMAAQAEAIKALVRDGGPQAVSIMEHLRTVLSDWQNQIKNDKAAVLNRINTLALAKDVQPLTRLLAQAQAAELEQQYDARITKVELANVALGRIMAAHKEMEASLADLSNKELVRRLKEAVSDLRTVQQAIAGIR